MHCLLTITARSLSHPLNKLIVPYNMAAANNSNNTTTFSTSTTPLAVPLQCQHCFHLQYLSNTNNVTHSSTSTTRAMLPLAAPRQHQQCWRLQHLNKTNNAATCSTLTTPTTLLSAVTQQTNYAAACSTLTTLTISALWCSSGYGCPDVFTIPVWLVKQYLNTDVSVYRYVHIITILRALLLQFSMELATKRLHYQL